MHHFATDSVRGRILSVDDFPSGCVRQHSALRGLATIIHRSYVQYGELEAKYAELAQATSETQEQTRQLQEF